MSHTHFSLEYEWSDEDLQGLLVMNFSYVQSTPQLFFLAKKTIGIYSAGNWVVIILFQCSFSCGRSSGQSGGDGAIVDNTLTR